MILLRAVVLKLPNLAPEIKEQWVDTVVNGSVADLQKALDGGLNAKVKTAKGTTALPGGKGTPETTLKLSG